MKMEEDNCEENHRQKKKRRQKDLKSQHENKNCTSDVKKEKKCRNVDPVAKEEEERGWDGSGNREKKKKIWKLDSNSVIVIDEENSVSKKKKKKLLSDDKNQLPNICNYVKEEKLEKKNVKYKSLLIKPESKKKEDEEVQQTGKNKIPKKDKIKREILTVSTEQTVDNVQEKKQKKERPVTTDDSTKTKKKLKVEENGIKLDETEMEVEKVKLKKTKKKVKTEAFDNGLEANELKSKKKKEIKDEKNLKRRAVDDDDVHKKTNVLTQSEKVTEEGKVKKRRKKRCGKVLVEDVIEVMEPKKKKKKKAKVEYEAEDTESRKKAVTVDVDAGKKKSKKNKTSVTVKQINTAVEAGVKKIKKIKKERKDLLEEQQNDFQFSQVDVVFLTQKSGNADEVNINQERRKALQMEIDEASQPQKPTTPTGLGQWSTAQFDSSKQQQKFLRLMGGFKKGFQPAVETAGGGGMAMGKNEQQQLQQGLLGEFERAHSRRMDFNNKGAGLGFTAPSNKKFSIDINASRSVRFDD